MRRHCLDQSTLHKAEKIITTVWISTSVQKVHEENFIFLLLNSQKIINGFQSTKKDMISLLEQNQKAQKGMIY
jgi:hypothetical protein